MTAEEVIENPALRAPWLKPGTLVSVIYDGMLREVCTVVSMFPYDGWVRLVLLVHRRTEVCAIDFHPSNIATHEVSDWIMPLKKHK